VSTQARSSPVTPAPHLAENGVLGWLDGVDILIKDRRSVYLRISGRRIKNGFRCTGTDVETIPQESRQRRMEASIDQRHSSRCFLEAQADLPNRTILLDATPPRIPPQTLKRRTFS
jgi:hypothetical protein